MNDPSLQRSRHFLRNCIQKSERKLQNRNLPITSGKIISDQTFGFWTSLFLAHHYTLLQGQPIQIFPHKLPKENRASLHAKLDTIKEFRNRVNHCEPLCFNGHQIDCSEALKVRDILYDLGSWINPQLLPFFKNLDNVKNKVDHLHTI